MPYSFQSFRLKVTGFQTAASWLSSSPDLTGWINCKLSKLLKQVYGCGVVFCSRSYSVTCFSARWYQIWYRWFSMSVWAGVTAVWTLTLLIIKVGKRTLIWFRNYVSIKQWSGLTYMYICVFRLILFGHLHYAKNFMKLPNVILYEICSYMKKNANKVSR